MYTPRQSSSSLSRAQADPADGIRVVIQPSQSSYFAGEPFTCTVTFTNLHAPVPTSQIRVASASFNPGHKRAAHSVSSAPLSRPPTSPGTPKTAQQFITSQNNELDTQDQVRRRGLIGKPVTSTVAAREKRLRLPTRSLSVDVSPQDLIKRLTDPGSPAAFLPRSERTSPTSPRVSSPLAREHNVLPPSHPHARKHSVTSDDISASSVSSASSPASAHPPPTPTTIPAFQLSLDPITENANGVHVPTMPAFPLTPSGSSDLIKPSPSPQPQGNRPGHARRLSLGLGFPLPGPQASNLRVKSTGASGQLPYTAFSTTFPASSTELLLYAYAQLTGTLTIDSDAIPSSEELIELREALRKGTAVGGGSLDIGSGHRPRSSSNGSLFGFLSSPTMNSQSPSSPGLISSFFGGGASASGLPADDDDAIPTLETQPTMLAVDLSLAAGESRSYSYVLTLPSHLPPTFKGRALRFSYQLIIGTCRATTPVRPNFPSYPIALTNSSVDGDRRRTRVMRVPIRVYNHVAVGRAPRPYDLMWPVARRRIPTRSGHVEEVRGDTNVAKQLKASGSLAGVQAYAKRLLTGEGELELEPALGEVGEAGALSGCAEAVEINTRNPKKVSYDVSKDGEKVAVLTFVKSAYRLGETVLGVVELNEELYRSKVLKLSAMLEAHESLPWGSSLVRRVYAEHHASLMSDVQRVAFALDIPSDASPAFEIVHHGDGVVGGLAWKVRMCLLVSIPTGGGSVKGKGREVEVRSLVRDGPAGEWGASWRASESIAPMERLRAMQEPATRKNSGSWTSLFSAFAGGKFHDADSEDEDDDREWTEIGVETVECIVPLRIYAGNTAFRAVEVSFEV